MLLIIIDHDQVINYNVGLSVDIPNQQFRLPDSLFFIMLEYILT